MKLFVYGELCKPAVLIAQLGRIPPMRPAILHGYRRHKNMDTGSYRAVPGTSSKIAGLLIDGLTAADLERLDVFEDVAGAEYRRVEVEVELVGTSGSAERAFAYIEGLSTCRGR